MYIAREATIPPDEGSAATVECSVCEQMYEVPDTADCPYHAGTIYSLCCTLESSCHDVCKTVSVGAEPSGMALPTAGVAG